jgi:hypothetical protein
MPKSRNRAAEAEARGRKLAMFEISQEFDTLIERVRAALAVEMGRCTRTQALERMGREGAKRLLRKT